MTHHEASPTSSFSSAIPGLDIILGGGIPQGALVLVMGPPGSGKTTLANQIGFAVARSGRKVAIFTAFSEPTSKLIEHLRQFAFFDANLIGVEILFLSLQAYLGDGIAAAGDALIAATREARADLVILDGFRGISGLTLDPQQSREFLFDVGTTLSLRGTTTIITSEAEPRDPAFYPESTTADLILGLSYAVRDHRTMRGIEAIKVRGGASLAGVHALGLDTTGILVYPRIETRAVPALPRPQVVDALPEWAATAISTASVPFALPSLDALLGGGLTRGTSTLLTGSLGTGKTLLSLHFAVAGVRMGEPVVYLGFRETMPQLLAKADAFALGQEVRAGLSARGALTLIRWEPVEMIPDQVLDHLLLMLDQTQARRLVIDSLAELQRAVLDTSQADRVANFLAALLALLRQRQVTMVGVLETDQVITATSDFSVDPLAVLAENVLLLQQVETHGQLQRVLSILKMRFSPHAAARSTFTITAPEGIQLGEPLERE